MIINDIILDFIFSVFSAFVALYISNLGSPKLKVIVLDPEVIQFSNGQSFRHLRLVIKNEPLKGVPFVSRQTAYSCHGIISFSDVRGKVKYVPMPARWSRNPQPIKYEVDNGEIKTLSEPSLIKSSQYIDIARDELEDLDVAIRFLQEVDAYGWNSDSYFHSGKNPAYKLPPGVYKVKIQITGSNCSTKKDFLLINHGDQFKLEEQEKRINSLFKAQIRRFKSISIFRAK